MYGRERRKSDVIEQAGLRAALAPAQQAALVTLEQFRWRLEFVRRPLFLDPVPVLRAPDGKRFVVLQADGSIDEAPDFRIRS